jgi:hypothetical protein
MDKTAMKFADAIEGIVEERGGLYGHPYDNFAVIAELWSIYLHATKVAYEGARLSREDIAHMMILLKVARSTHGEENADTIDDIAGYAKCIHLIREKEAEV